MQRIIQDIQLNSIEFTYKKNQQYYVKGIQNPNRNEKYYQENSRHAEQSKARKGIQKKMFY